MSTAEHDHGPTAKLLDPVWCITCDHEHIATIPSATFACADCGFGAWGSSVAASHAAALPEHVVYVMTHQTIPLPDGDGCYLRTSIPAEMCPEHLGQFVEWLRTGKPTPTVGRTA